MSRCRVWHPLSTVDEGEGRTNMVGGEGIYLYDENGRAYIDGLSGLWNVSLGYGNREIIEAVTRQLSEIPYVNLCEHRNGTADKLADQLLQLLHREMAAIYFTCTGSESNELAIKMIHKYQALQNRPGRTKIGVLSGSYHGSYYGSLSASQFEAEHKKGYGAFLDGFVQFPLPFCRCCRSDALSDACLEDMLRACVSLFEETGEELGGIIVEPILGSGGILPLPPQYLQLLAALCSAHDILLVCDEVATGFGRTGLMFGYEHAAIEPDIVCMSKGINSGYLPLGAVAVNKKIEAVFKDAGELLFHLSTQNGNPVCCASAIATLDLIGEKSGMLDHIQAMSALFQAGIAEALRLHPNFYELRAAGLMFAIDLLESQATGALLSQRKLMDLVRQLKRNGLIAEFCYNRGVTSSVLLFLPFIIQPEEVQKTVGIIERTFRKLI